MASKNLPESSKTNNDFGDEEVVDESIRLKDRAGDLANKWLAKNRSLVLRQTPIWAQSLSIILLLLGSGAVIGGIFFRVDEVVTAQGQLKSIGGVFEVKTPVGGKISKVFFKDGSLVRKGQQLLIYDTREVLQEQATLKSLIKLENQKLTTERLSFESQISSLDNQKKVLEKKYETNKIILENMKSLLAVGGFQRLQYLQKQDELYALENQISELEERRERINLGIKNANINNMRNMDQLMNSLKQAEFKLSYQNVIAPIDGIVFDPQVSENSVLASGERILSIVPQQGLFAEVFIPNKDIGYIAVNQPAKIRVDAFPFSRYGEIDGKISQIGAEALAPDSKASYYRFPVKIVLDQYYLKHKDSKIPLSSGMAITTNLKLRDKPVISLISDVFVNQADSVRSLRQQ